MRYKMDMRSVIENSRFSLEIKKQYPQKLICTCLNPECGRPKMTVDLAKEVFRCPACDYSGAPVDLWADLNNITGSKEERRKEAGRDFNKVMGGDIERKPMRKPLPQVPKVRESNRANTSEVHKTLQMLLRKLPLRPEHKENLVRRGLAEKCIEINGYASAPLTATKNLCHELLLEGCTLEGVPGFFKGKTGEWQFVKYGDGILIPSRDTDGNIHDLQVRLTSPKEGQPRYLTISSSGKECGCAGSTVPHFNPGRGETKIILTEGPLKADIVSCLKGYPTIAVLGVNSLSALPEMLKAVHEYGYSHIHIGYDMDMYTNKNVWCAYCRLQGIIQSEGMSFDTLEWPDENKGLDDHLFSKLKA